MDNIIVRSSEIIFDNHVSGVGKIAYLMSKEFNVSKNYAEQLIAIIPLAFSWALMRKRGVKEYPSNLKIKNDKGLFENIDINKISVLTSSIVFAEYELDNEFPRINRAHFELMLKLSSEYNLLLKIHSGELDPSELVLPEPALVGFIGEDFERAPNLERNEVDTGNDVDIKDSLSARLFNLFRKK